MKEKPNISFDKEYLLDTINKGKELLQTKNLSRRTRQGINIDIETFSNYINDNFELQDLNCHVVTIPKNIDKLKEHIISIMIKDYKTLGEPLIRWIIELKEANIFKNNNYSYDITDIPYDEQVELILKNYETNSPKYKEVAKNIILDEKIKQIHFAECDPYCHYSTITKSSFIIIDPDEAPCLFNHELQHAIEAKFKYKTSPLYWELGAIYHEMLFNEEIYKTKGYLNSGDYNMRLEDVNVLLKSTYTYFKTLLIFAEKNFDITTNEFLETFIKVGKVTPVILNCYLRESIAKNQMAEDMNYLFSILKSIELRDKHINYNQNQFEVLEAYLKRKKFLFSKPKDKYDIYTRYIDEMKQKTKKKRKH